MLQNLACQEGFLLASRSSILSIPVFRSTPGPSCQTVSQTAASPPRGNPGLSFRLKLYGKRDLQGRFIDLMYRGLFQ